MLRLIRLALERLSAPELGQSIAELALVAAPIALVVAFVLGVLVLHR